MCETIEKHVERKERAMRVTTFATENIMVFG
jgi:hypothetical protein